MYRNKRKLRVNNTKLRLSDHCFAIETGRRRSPKVDREDRFCLICNEEFIEDEKHFLLKCENYSDLRNAFLNNVFESDPNTKQLFPDDLLQLMFLCEDQETINNLLKFIGQITASEKKRYKLEISQVSLECRFICNFLPAVCVFFISCN